MPFTDNYAKVYIKKLLAAKSTSKVLATFRWRDPGKLCRFAVLTTRALSDYSLLMY